MKRRLKIIAFVAFALLTVWLLLVAITIWQFGFTDHSRNSDCAIVLGAAVNGSTPSPVFRERLNHAISLYNEGMVSSLVLTGGTGSEQSYSEGAVGERYCLARGIPATSLFKEEASKTTRENLIEAKRVMEAQELVTAIIVSDPLHLKRASMMSDDLGIESVTSPTPSSCYRTFKTRFGFLIRELYFVHHYKAFGH